MMSPTCSQMRNRICSPAGRSAFSLAMASCTATAHCTASTALAKSATRLSPAVLKIRPRSDAIRRSTEQAHEAGDIPRPGDIAPFAGLSGARKQAADQLVRHIEHGVGKPGFEIKDGGDEDRASSVRHVAADLMRIRDAALADKLLK